MSMENTNSVHDNEQFDDVENTFESADHLSENPKDDKSDEGDESSSPEMNLPEEVELPEDIKEPEEGDDANTADARQATADYSTLTKVQLVEQLSILISGKPVEAIKNDIESIKICFYKKHKEEFDQKRNDYIEKGGNPENFKYEDKLEKQLKDELAKYKELRREFNVSQEQQRQNNLNAKLKIIEEIKLLANSHEKLHDTYHKFRDFQKQWREIGLVPQKDVTDLYESYNHTVELFYDFLKLNKDLKDLDLKKNLEHKIQLCEKAEELLLEPSVIKAFNALQEYHNQWREIGPVLADKRAEMWDRFKAATAKINKSYQEYFEKIKEDQKKNLELKTQICDKSEEFLKTEIITLQDWEEKSKAMIELQHLWRTIGFAPRKDNNKIYQRFREICNDFFNRKKEFFSKIKEGQSKNYQLKLDICMQAESLKESKDWKKTTDEMIQLQKRWKEIGPVPRKHSDAIWKRFRAACDAFFSKKSEYFSTIDTTYEGNLALKLALIEEIKNYKQEDNLEKSISDLKSFQAHWSEIGFVPLQKKEEITRAYREAIDHLFDLLQIDDGKRRMLKFKSKMDGMAADPKSSNKMFFERDKFITQLRKLENDIKLWENNIGFFAKSKNAEIMIREVQEKIEKAKQEINMLEDKVNMIDKMIK
jgi:hypothetical protein